eukprot:c33441_g1_i1 orf=67-282(+)
MQSCVQSRPRRTYLFLMESLVNACEKFLKARSSKQEESRQKRLEKYKRKPNDFTEKVLMEVVVKIPEISSR